MTRNEIIGQWRECDSNEFGMTCSRAEAFDAHSVWKLIYDELEDLRNDD